MVAVNGCLQLTIRVVRATLEVGELVEWRGRVPAEKTLCGAAIGA